MVLIVLTAIDQWWLGSVVSITPCVSVFDFSFGTRDRDRWCVCYWRLCCVYMVTGFDCLLLPVKGF